MAYQTGTATSQQDFLNKLLTFAVAQGWTQDDWDTTNKEAAMHKGSCYVSFRWDATASTGGISIHQALGYTGGLTPGNHPNDSGNGQKTGTPITLQRRIDRIGNGSFTNHYFFAGTSPDYLHAVLEYSSGLYRHVSFGNLDKEGTWTGGEFAMGHVWDSTATQVDNPTYNRHCLPFDAAASYLANLCGTLHCESFPDEPSVDTKWAVVWGGTSAGNDGDANPRINVFGGVRDGPHTAALAWIRANPANGYVPLIPISLFYRYTTPTPHEWRLLGYVPGMRVVNNFYLADGQEFTVGSDTWKVFPWVRKQWNLADTDESHTGGFAYKK